MHWPQDSIRARNVFSHLLDRYPSWRCSILPPPSPCRSQTPPHWSCYRTFWCTLFRAYGPCRWLGSDQSLLAKTSYGCPDTADPSSRRRLSWGSRTNHQSWEDCRYQSATRWRQLDRRICYWIEQDPITLQLSLFDSLYAITIMRADTHYTEIYKFSYLSAALHEWVRISPSSIFAILYLTMFSCNVSVSFLEHHIIRLQFPHVSAKYRGMYMVAGRAHASTTKSRESGNRSAKASSSTYLALPRLQTVTSSENAWWPTSVDWLIILYPVWNYEYCILINIYKQIWNITIIQLNAIWQDDEAGENSVIQFNNSQMLMISPEDDQSILTEKSSFNTTGLS